MQFFTNRKRGFTLIELLVVIAIIGTLATIVLVSLNRARSKARDTRRASDLRQIAMGLEMFYDATGDYPTAAQGTAILATQNYMASVPTDPQSGNAYGYGPCQTSEGTDIYTLGAALEDNTSSLLDNDVNDATCTLVGTPSGTGTSACADASGYYCIEP